MGPAVLQSLAHSAPPRRPAGSPASVCNALSGGNAFSAFTLNNLSAFCRK
jgi:hypothetical protein